MTPHLCARDAVPPGVAGQPGANGICRAEGVNVPS